MAAGKASFTVLHSYEGLVKHPVISHEGFQDGTYPVSPTSQI